MSIAGNIRQTARTRGSDGTSIELIPWTGPWPDDDPDTNFKKDVALYSKLDPLETIEALSKGTGIPVGAIVRYDRAVGVGRLGGVAQRRPEGRRADVDAVPRRRGGRHPRSRWLRTRSSDRSCLAPVPARHLTRRTVGAPVDSGHEAHRDRGLQRRGRCALLPDDLPRRAATRGQERSSADHDGLDPAGRLDAVVRRRRLRGRGALHARLGAGCSRRPAPTSRSVPTTPPTWPGTTCRPRRRSPGCTSRGWWVRRPGRAAIEGSGARDAVHDGRTGVPRDAVGHGHRHDGAGGQRLRDRRPHHLLRAHRRRVHRRLAPGLRRRDRRLRDRGCDAVALACTEIPLLVRPEDSPLPTLDSTRLLAAAALREALA